MPKKQNLLPISIPIPKQLPSSQMSSDGIHTIAENWLIQAKITGVKKQQEIIKEECFINTIKTTTLTIFCNRCKTKTSNVKFRTYVSTSKKTRPFYGCNYCSQPNLQWIESVKMKIKAQAIKKNQKFLEEESVFLDSQDRSTLALFCNKCLRKTTGVSLVNYLKSTSLYFGCDLCKVHEKGQTGSEGSLLFQNKILNLFNGKSFFPSTGKKRLEVHSFCPLDAKPTDPDFERNGVPLNYKIHQAFHKEYGFYGNNTQENFEKFCKEKYKIFDFPWANPCFPVLLRNQRGKELTPSKLRSNPFELTSITLRRTPSVASITCYLRSKTKGLGEQDKELLRRGVASSPSGTQQQEGGKSKASQGVFKVKNLIEPLEIPFALQELLPDYFFKVPRVEPGVYLIYQPALHKVYIGQAKNISAEISVYLTLRVPTMDNNFKEAIKQYGRNSFLRISVCSAKNLEDEAERLLLEKRLIIQLQQICYNKKENPLFNVFQKESKLERKPVIKDTWEIVEYIFVYGSLEIYNLRDVNVLPYEKGKSSIYLMINCKTFRFYIGETRDLKATKRITKHKGSLQEVVSLIRNNESISSFSRYPAYEQMAMEIIETESANFAVGCLEIFDCNDKKERVIRESFWKDKLAKQYPGRVYNVTQPRSFEEPRGDKA